MDFYFWTLDSVKEDDNFRNKSEMWYGKNYNFKDRNLFDNSFIYYYVLLLDPTGVSRDYFK